MFKTSKQKVNTFHKIFADTLGPQETIVFDCSCALIKEILIHGRLYVTENYICFYGQFLKWSKSLIINFADVLSIRKTKKLRFSAMEISTSSGKNYLFSFLPKLKAHYSKIKSIWQNFSSSTGLETRSDVNDSISGDSIISNTPLLTSSSPEKIKESRSCIEFSRNHLNSREKFHFQCFSSNFFNPEELNCGNSDRGMHGGETCSYQGKGSLVNRFKFSASPDKIFELLFIKNKGWDIKGGNNVNFTLNEEWRQLDDNTPKVVDGERVICSRRREYSMELNYPFAKSVTNSESQYIVCFRPNNLYTLKFVVNSSGLPFASSMYTISTMCIMKGTREDEDKCEVHLHFEMIFTKSCWGMQNFILDGSLKITRDVWNKRANGINQIIEREKEYYSQTGLDGCLFSSCLLKTHPEDQFNVLGPSPDSEVLNHVKSISSANVVSSLKKDNRINEYDLVNNYTVSATKSNPANLSSFAFLFLILILIYLAFVPSFLNMNTFECSVPVINLKIKQD